MTFSPKVLGIQEFPFSLKDFVFCYVLQMAYLKTVGHIWIYKYQ